MTVYRRNRPPAIKTDNLKVSNVSVSPREKSLSSSWRVVLLFFCLAAVIVLKQHAVDHDNAASGWQGNTGNKSSIHDFQLTSGVTLRLSLNLPDEARAKHVATMGPHQITVSFPPGCESPHAWIRFTGEALVLVPLAQSRQSEWSGTFSFPVEGTYLLEVRSHGCDASSDSWSSFLSLPGTNLTVVGNGNNTSVMSKSMSSEPVFPEGVWLSSENFKVSGASPSYIWHDLKTPPQEASIIEATSSLGSSLVSKEATPIHDKFGDLSNYELVCWVGDKSASTIREAFLSLRPSLFRGQRPFKFHYYNLTSFEKPDQHWDESDKKRFRKCKTILVSVDKLDSPVTRAEYKGQVKTFVGHLLKAFPDDSFPVWIITVNEPPMSTSSMCSSPPTWSANHNCNDALFDLFAGPSFPPRVKLLDTTDLVNPQFDENQQDIMAVIAMRVFALVGHQVAAWRRAKQVGRNEGLVRNGKVLPNPEQIPYTWST